MGRFAVYSTLLFVTSLFAGCASSEGGSSAAPEPSSVVGATGEPLSDAGTIAGKVVDDAIVPIPNAQVGIIELGLVATTGEDGSFQFLNLAPGTYNIQTAALGYQASPVKRVELPASETLELMFTLTAIEILTPYAEIVGPLAGYFECRVGYRIPAYGASTGACHGALDDNDQANLEFQMQNHTQAFVGEMEWTQGSFATSQRLRLSFSYTERSNTHWFCTATNQSPIRWDYVIQDGDGTCLADVYCGITESSLPDNQPDVPSRYTDDDEDMILRVYTNTPFGCNETDNLNPVEFSFQQKFQMVVTMFHGMPVPDGYSGFSDG